MSEKKKETEGISRRRYLKYGAAAVVVAAAAAGGAYYYSTLPPPTPTPATTTETITTITQPTTVTTVTSSGVYGGTLRVRVEADPVGLDPHLASDFSSSQIDENCFDKLVRYDYNYAILPSLAVSWEQPKDTTYIFHLRKGVSFHDGNAFTADDVKYNIERIMNPATAAPAASNFEPVQSVSVVDDYTVKFELKRPFSPFLGKLAAFGGEMVSRNAVEKYGDLKHNPVGTGPFKYVEWVEGDHVTYERFKDYWKPGLPFLDKIVFKPMLDGTVALESLYAGEVDMVYALPHAEMKRVRSEGKLILNVEIGTAAQGVWINTAKSPLNDKRVRQALSYSLDAQEMVDSIFFTEGAVKNNQPMPPNSPWHIADLPSYKRDINKAKQLLAEAGYPKGTSFTLLLPPFGFLRDMGLVAKDQAKDAGFDIATESLEWGVFLDRVLTKKDYVAAVCGWVTFVDPDDFLYTQFHTGGGWNFVNVSNPEVDRLLDEGRAETDPSKRREIYTNLMKTLIDEAPYVWLITQNYPVAWRPQVKGFRNLPMGWLRLEETWLSPE